MKPYTRRAHARTAAASQRGAAAVEFAIVCSLLLLIVFGIIEFSIMLYDKAVITNASREGARAGIVYELDRNSGSVQDRVNEAVDLYAANLINFGAGSTLGRTVTIGGGGSVTDGQALTVSLTYTYNFLVFPNLAALFGGSLGSSIELQAQTVMRME